MSPISKLKKLFAFNRKNSDRFVVCRKKLDVSDKLLGLLKRLQDAGYEAYIVGGAVRDLLLHREPKDYDVATSATPEQIRNVFGRRQARIIGKRFRLVHVYLGQSIIEVSTFRRTPSSPGKIPAPLQKHSKTLPDKLIFDDNSFGTASQDAFRRDFTVNALFYDPFRNEIRDYTGMGLADIESGTVRVIGNPGERFEEDPVRILRALKLVGQYGFEFEPETGRVLREQISMIAHASSSRLALELEKILKSQYSDKIFEAFHEYGMLKYFLPGLESIYDSADGRLIMKLLAVRNGRVSKGIYKSSISIPMAILALPNLSKAAAVTTGELWKKESFEYDDLMHIVRSGVAPHAMMRCLTEMAAGVLHLQPDLAANGGRRRINQALREHAVELFRIMNEAIWHDREKEANLLTGTDDSRDFRPRKRRYRRSKPRGEAAKQPVQTDTGKDLL